SRRNCKLRSSRTGDAGRDSHRNAMVQERDSARGSPPSRSERIRFILGGEMLAVDGVEPTRTVLNFLRESLGRKGTKEGCAEGDCGACTVVVGELCGEQVQLRTVNSCLQFVPALDGKALFSVEDVRLADGTLHPVQHAMVAHHGSQCGFCTPGFIMS